MKRRWFLLLVCTAVAVLPSLAAKPAVAGVAAVPHAAADENKSANGLGLALIEKQKAAVEAEKTRDSAFFKRVLSDDFVGVEPNGDTSEKDDFLQNLRLTEITESMVYDWKVVPLNDGAVVVTYDEVVHKVVGDHTDPRYQHVSAVWVRQGQEWKLKFQQSTPNRWSAGD